MRRRKRYEKISSDRRRVATEEGAREEVCDIMEICDEIIHEIRNHDKGRVAAENDNSRDRG